VVNTSRTKAPIETGGSGPRVSWYMTLAASSQSRKDRQQHQSQHHYRTEPWRADYAECIYPGDVKTLLASSAHFIEAHRRDRADKREAGRERK
jgi:hypothetical protein